MHERLSCCRVSFLVLMHAARQRYRVNFKKMIDMEMKALL